MKREFTLTITVSEELWPVEVVDEIQKVMEQGFRDGKTGWENKPTDVHVHHADIHLRDWTRAKLNRTPVDVTDLTHAFTRLMMAVAIERGYTKGGNAVCQKNPNE